MHGEDCSNQGRLPMKMEWSRIVLAGGPGARERAKEGVTGREGGIEAGGNRDYFIARRGCWPDCSGVFWGVQTEGNEWVD